MEVTHGRWPCALQLLHGARAFVWPPPILSTVKNQLCPNRAGFICRELQSCSLYAAKQDPDSQESQAGREPRALQPPLSPMPVPVEETVSKPIASWHRPGHLDPRRGGPLRGSMLTYFHSSNDCLTHFHLILNANG